MAIKKWFYSESRLLWVIFIAFFVVRAGFVLLSGYNSFELQPDTERYNQQSDGILAGQYDLEEFLFITAPVYPYFEALFKLVFGSHWIPALQLTQILLSSLSGVFLYKTAKLIWNRTDIALLAALIYCFFPMTFWWVHTFSQETLFQCLLIFTLYYLLDAVYGNKFRSLVISALLFSVTFHTKSHILFFAPFIPLFIFLAWKTSTTNKFVYSAVFAAICLLSTLPYGLYNLKENGVYTISSTGFGGHFLTGHNDDTYMIVVNPPPKNSPEAQRLIRMDLYVFRELTGKIQGLSHSEIQDLFLRTGIQWCRENPRKAFELTLFNLYRSLMPGVNLAWYSFNQWLMALVVSAPVYLLGYTGIILSLKHDFKRHFWILGLFISVLLFSMGFYVQNRFRTITIEPYYIMFAAFAVSYLLSKYSQKYKNWADSFELNMKNPTK